MSAPPDHGAPEQHLRASGAYAEALAPATTADAIDDTMPRYVAAPTSIEQVAEVIACAARDGTAIVCTGAGTLAEVGNTPRAFDIALRTSALARVVEHNPDDMTICVQAGMTCDALDELLARSGQRIAIDVTVPRATIGGIVAANETGGLACGFGLPRDLVLGLTVVDGGGRTLRLGGRVVKNVSGYDLVRLFAGSFGTLGVIVDVTLRAHPRPAHASTLAVAFDDAESFDAARAAVFAAALPLAAFDFTLNDTPAAPWTLHIRQESISTREAAYRRAELERLCGGRAAVEDTLRTCSPVFAPGDHDLALRCGVPPAALAKVAQELSSASHIPLRFAGRCGDGMLRMSARCEDARAAGALARDMRRRMNAIGHRVVIERLPASEKAGVDVWDEAPEGLRLMREIKRRFDPAGILSPGRFVGGI